MYTDSCVSGFGGTFKSNYTAGNFPTRWQKLSVEVLELYPIFLFNLFHEDLTNKKIVFHCDNLSVVHIINNFKCLLIMKLVRPMVLLMLKNNLFPLCIYLGNSIDFETNFL